MLTHLSAEIVDLREQNAKSAASEGLVRQVQELRKHNAALQALCDQQAKDLAHAAAAREAAEMAMREAELARDEAEAARDDAETGRREAEEQLARLAEVADEADRQLQASMEAAESMLRAHEAALVERDATIASLRDSLAAATRVPPAPSVEPSRGLALPVVGAPTVSVMSSPASSTASLAIPAGPKAALPAVPVEIVAALKGHRPSALRQGWSSPERPSQAAPRSPSPRSGSRPGPDATPRAANASGAFSRAMSKSPPPMATAAGTSGARLTSPRPARESSSSADLRPVSPSGARQAETVIFDSPLEYASLLRTIVSLEDENTWLTQCLARVREQERIDYPNYDGRGECGSGCIERRGLGIVSNHSFLFVCAVRWFLGL
jgi:hypothetical protein